MSSKLLDLAVKCRDAFLAASDAFQQYIEESKPPELASWDASQIRWAERTGQKGLFQVSEDSENIQFRRMLNSLESHGGTMFKDGFFYWRFQNGQAVGRKKK